MHDFFPHTKLSVLLKMCERTLSSLHDSVQVAMKHGYNQGCKVASLICKVQVKVREAPNEQMVVRRWAKLWLYSRGHVTHERDESVGSSGTTANILLRAPLIILPNGP